MGFLQTWADGLGVDVLLHADRDSLILIAQRFCRLFAYGLSLLIMVLFMTGLGHGEAATGVFMSLTILGDIVISMVLTIVADQIGRRRTLAFGAASVVFSGVVFATGTSYWLLLLGSVLGVITPTGNEIGPFKAIEESTICQLVPMKHRPQVLAWYYSLGTVGVALGTLTCGLLVETLQRAGWDAVASYRAVFWLYTLLGALKFALCLLLSPACELEALGKTGPPRMEEEEEEEDASTLLPPPHVEEALRPAFRATLATRLRALMPHFEPESRDFILKMAGSFFVDQLANGILPYSFMVYYWRRRFALSDDQNGAIFFVLLIVAAASNMAAAALTRALGAVPAMLLTHVASSLSAALIPVPRRMWWAMVFLVGRFATQDMNQVPRQAFIASALRPEERTVAIGLMQLVRTAGTAAGPMIVGYLTQRDRFWIDLELFAGIRVVYVLLIWYFFWGYRTREEREGEYGLVGGRAEGEAEGDEGFALGSESDSENGRGDGPENERRSESPTLNDKDNPNNDNRRQRDATRGKRTSSKVQRRMTRRAVHGERGDIIELDILDDQDHDYNDDHEHDLSRRDSGVDVREAP